MNFDSLLVVARRLSNNTNSSGLEQIELELMVNHLAPRMPSWLYNGPQPILCFGTRCNESDGVVVMIGFCRRLQVLGTRIRRGNIHGDQCDGCHVQVLV